MADDGSGPVTVILANGTTLAFPAAVWRRCNTLKNLVDDIDVDDDVAIPLPDMDRSIAEWLVAFTARFPSDETITNAFIETMRSDERQRKTEAEWHDDPMYKHFTRTTKPCKREGDARIPISTLILQLNHVDASYALLCATQHMARLIRETPKHELEATFCLKDDDRPAPA